MRIHGKRHDGSLLVNIGGGVGVITRGAYASKPTDLRLLTNMGPWEDADNSLEMRRAVQKDLDRARTLPVENFRVGPRK